MSLPHISLYQRKRCRPVHRRFFLRNAEERFENVKHHAGDQCVDISNLRVYQVLHNFSLFCTFYQSNNCIKRQAEIIQHFSKTLSIYTCVKPEWCTAIEKSILRKTSFIELLYKSIINCRNLNVNSVSSFHICCEVSLDSWSPVVIIRNIVSVPFICIC